MAAAIEENVKLNITRMKDDKPILSEALAAKKIAAYGGVQPYCHRQAEFALMTQTARLRGAWPSFEARAWRSLLRMTATPRTMSTQGTLERWRSEKTAAFLSAAVATAEPDPAKAALFKDMAAAARRAGRHPRSRSWAHAGLHAIPPLTPHRQGHSRFGPRAMRPILSATKVRGVSVYSGKTEAPARHPWPETVEDIGKQHRNFGGGTLRAGVFGVNAGSCPTPAWSWAWPAPRPSRKSSFSPALPGCSPEPSRWPPASSFPCCRSPGLPSWRILRCSRERCGSRRSATDFCEMLQRTAKAAFARTGHCSFARTQVTAAPINRKP